MRKAIYTIAVVIASVSMLSLSSCSDDKTTPSSYEFMPNMYRSPSMETYSMNNVFADSMNARQPVEGTMPRGFVGYDYDNSLEDYLRAGKEMVTPFEATEENLAKGKKLYAMFCTHCHGKKGDGAGTITHAVYGAVPSYADDVMARRTGKSMSELSAGNIYHTIYHGLNAMGPHASQLNNDERWLITMYVQELQKGNN
ncbi:MAG: cytochrome c [Bacteroidetes bacterium]|nr:cytochrome c [Bacteroidota bacterium]